MTNVANADVSKRDRHLGRLREKYPDKKFEDDEEIFGQIGEDYDNYEKELNGYKESGKAMSDMFASDPYSAEFLVGLSKGDGKNAVLGLLKHLGPDIKEALDDPETMEKLADMWAKDQEHIANSKKLDDEYAENMPKSLDALRQFQQEKGLSDEQCDEIIFSLIEIVRNGVIGKFDAKGFEFAMNAINHDTDVAQAQEEGTVAGRNQKVTEKLRKSQKGDGITALDGKNGKGGAPKQKASSIFDVANEAQSPWG